jgi:hypothetical protein
MALARRQCSRHRIGDGQRSAGEAKSPGVIVASPLTAHPAGRDIRRRFATTKSNWADHAVVSDEETAWNVKHYGLRSSSERGLSGGEVSA